MIKNDINNKPLYSGFEDDPTLYTLPDDDRDPKDAYDPDEEFLYDEDSSDDDTDSDDDTGLKSETEVKKAPVPLGILLRSMLTPVEGLKALKRARFKTEEFASKCFYPLIALAAVSDISGLFYKANFSIADWMMTGFTTFITFFFSYFTILLAGVFVLPRKSRPLLKKDIGKQFVMLALSTLAIFWTVIQLVPMLEPVLVFLPLWTIYLIYKGVRVIRVPSEVENSTTGFLCMLIIGAPILWNWLLSELLIPATVASGM